MSNLNSVFRTDFESFMRKCFRILNPGQKPVSFAPLLHGRTDCQWK
jgi:hypothetical protein